MLRCFVIVMLSMVLFSCASVSEKQELAFQLDGRNELYEKSGWSFVGRIALLDSDSSFSAAISWVHEGENDEIELSGPFGQGRTIIWVTGSSVEIDNGDEHLQYFGDVDMLISRQLGVSVPVSALRYWLLGLVHPRMKYTEQAGGFVQSGWQVTYHAMQQEGKELLPRKLRIEQDKTKLKLVIGEWDLK